jgi:hypothetical protein
VISGIALKEEVMQSKEDQKRGMMPPNLFLSREPKRTMILAMLCLHKV